MCFLFACHMLSAFVHVLPVSHNSCLFSAIFEVVHWCFWTPSWFMVFGFCFCHFGLWSFGLSLLLKQSLLSLLCLPLACLAFYHEWMCPTLHSEFCLAQRSACRILSHTYVCSRIRHRGFWDLQTTIRQHCETSTCHEQRMWWGCYNTYVSGCIYTHR